MEALFISTGVVALAEIGEKTQLLAFILAARFKKPVPIIAGILCATLINHGLAGALGAWITSTVSPDILRWILGVSFLGMAVWTLIPDKIEDEETQIAHRLGVFGATFITFFLAEMGEEHAKIALAVASRESGFRETAFNAANTDASNDGGCWQINSIHRLSDEIRYDCKQSTEWAISKVKRDGGWNAWVAYRYIGQDM
jgi:hypothetical protein